MTDELTAQVRMYRLGELGDCFLLSFAQGDEKSHMLIDCGSFRNSTASKTRLAEVVKDIRARLDGARLDVIAGTHQHNDHLSGFVHCEAALREIGVDRVWLSWLDDDRDPVARSVGSDSKRLRLALSIAREQLRRMASSKRGLRALETLNAMLDFYAAKGSSGPPVVPAEAVAILKNIGKEAPVYLKPGRVLDLPGMPAESVRVYVLGPPRDSELLFKKDPRSGESYDPALASASLAASKFLDAVNVHRGLASSDEAQYPFSEGLKFRSPSASPAVLRKVMRSYRARKDAWRTIDDDWLGQAETLSLYLDSYTNNTSLVLAIELVKSGKVLLFAADAQRGNWVSWRDVKWSRVGTTTDDLLARTVLYKVGHHGSHNATLVDGLEKMTHPDLMALISVDKSDPNIAKPAGWKMPSRNLMKRLGEKTSHRVLRMDGANNALNDPKREPALSAWKRIGIKPMQTALYVDLKIVG